MAATQCWILYEQRNEVLAFDELEDLKAWVRQRYPAAEIFGPNERTGVFYANGANFLRADLAGQDGEVLAPSGFFALVLREHAEQMIENHRRTRGQQLPPEA